jgi:DNA-binding Lrp family transcriptional regulator
MSSKRCVPVAQRPSSWRDVLPIHPAAELFPLMSPDELRALGEDIKKNKLKQPVTVLLPDRSQSRDTVWQGAALLDGRNRLDAMEMVGIQLVGENGEVLSDYVRFKFSDDTDPYAYVISANIHRRHLTAEDKDRLIVQLLKANPTKSNRQVAKLTNTSHPHVAKVREQAEKNGDVETVTTSIDTKGRAQPAKRNLTLPNLHREAKLGADIVNKLKGTSLDNAREQDELIVLNRGAPNGELTDIVKQLTDDAVAGKPVSAIEYTKSGVAFRRDDIGADSGGKIERLPNGARALMASREEASNSLDYFPTPPWATRALIERVLPVLGIQPSDLAQKTAWEMACGEGHMAEVLREYFGQVAATDIAEYGYGESGIDFLDAATRREADWGTTNPPFDDKAIKFVLRALKLARVGVAMFVRLQWLETIERYEQIFRDHPPTLVAFFVERVNLCKGRWEPEGTTATAYCWLVWLRGEAPRPPFWIPPGCREHLTRADDAARFTTHPVTRLSPADDGLDIPPSLPRTAPQSRSPSGGQS